MESNRTLDQQAADLGADGQMHCCLFGMRTVATNEASAARQKDASGSQQVDQIEDRFRIIGSGQWVDRTREGVGPRWDLDVLAAAAAEVAVAKGHAPAGSEAATTVKFRSQLENGKPAANGKPAKTAKECLAQLRDIPEVVTAYKARQGKTVRTANDLVGMLD